MIELINGYCISVDPLNYTLKKKAGVDKEGNPTYRTCGYYGSVKSAITHCVDLIQRDKLSEGTYLH